jgi:hypothetical protein
MIKKIKNGGILALVLAAGMAVLQPASAQAAERHDRGGYEGRGRVERNWNGGRGNWGGRDYRDYRGSDRDRGRVYYNYRPAPRYGYGYYAYPSYGYPAYGYSYCPR